MKHGNDANARLLFSPRGGKVGGGAIGGTGNAGGIGGNSGGDDDDVKNDLKTVLAATEGSGESELAVDSPVREPHNFYDDEVFYSGYVGLRQGTHSANDHIERPYLEAILPDVKDKRVLDLGCGMGTYTIDLLSGAESIDAVDISERMLANLKTKVEQRGLKHIRVIRSSIENFDFQTDHYDLILCMLAFHYIADLVPIFAAISRSLRKGASFIFNVEHPIYTAAKNQGWETGNDGTHVHWRMDNYFEGGARRAIWLGVEVERYHRTVEDYFNLLITNGLQVVRVLEPKPSNDARRLDPELDRHYRRPPFLMFLAHKE